MTKQTATPAPVTASRPLTQTRTADPGPGPGPQAAGRRGLKAGPVPADLAGVSAEVPQPVPPARSDGGAPSVWPRCSLALALLAGAQAVLLLAAGREPGRLWPAVAELTLGAGLLLFGWLTGSRRLPTWRRDQLLTALLLAGTALAGVEAGGYDQPWQLAELPIIGGVAAVLLADRAWTWAVATAGPAATAGAVAASATGPGAASFGWQPWAGTALVVLTGAATTVWLQRARAGWAQALADARQVATEQGVRDPLTGATNRRGLELVAGPMLEHARRDGQAVHCLVADVDGLRVVNEQVGTRGGDEVLQCVAEALRESSRTTDVVARWGADQFILIGPGTGTSPLEMERRVRSRVKAQPPVPEQVWGGKVSVGSATLVPWDDGDLGSLISRAESDMSLRRSLRRRAEASRRAEPPEAGAAPDRGVSDASTAG